MKKQRIHHVEPYLLNPQHPVTISLIGCGGNGSQVLTNLARIHEALRRLNHLGLHVTCFDPDTVSDANMGRQLFSPAELGMNKAVALITRINRFFGTSWKALPVKYTIDVKYKDRSSNFTISCVDTLAARKEIKKVLDDRFKTPDPQYKTMYWLDLGNTRDVGQFVMGTLFPHKTKEHPFSKTVTRVYTLPDVFERLPEMLKVKEKDQGPSCSLAEALDRQDLFINSMLSQVATATIWKMFREGSIDYHGAFINLKTLKIAPIYL